MMLLREKRVTLVVTPIGHAAMSGAIAACLAIGLALRVGFAQSSPPAGATPPLFAPPSVADVSENAPGVASRWAPSDLHAADLDSDGSMDLVMHIDGNIAIAFGDSSGRFVEFSQVQLPRGWDSSRIALGRFVSPTATDIASLEGLTSKALIARNGSGTFSRTIPLDDRAAIALNGGPLSADAIFSHDLNGDGRHEIVLGEGERAHVFTLHSNGTVAQYEDVDGGGGGGGPLVAIADVDRDTFPDLVFQASSGLHVVRHLGREASPDDLFEAVTGTILLPAPVPSGGRFDQVLIAPLRSGGDLILRTGSDVFVVFNVADPGAVGAVYLSGSAEAVAVAELTGDGRSEIIVFDPPSMRVFVNSGTGAFSVQPDILLQVLDAAGVPVPLAGFNFAADVADADGDGRLDVLIANEDWISVIRGRSANATNNPSKPQLLSPSAGSLATSRTKFEWSPISASGSEYRLEISDSRDFTTIRHTVVTRSTSTSVPLNRLQEASEWFWRVSASSAGRVVGVSDVSSFRAGSPTDVNGDSRIDRADIVEMLLAWGECPRLGSCPADVDGDGFIGINDLADVLRALSIPSRASFKNQKAYVKALGKEYKRMGTLFPTPRTKPERKQDVRRLQDAGRAIN